MFRVHQQYLVRPGPKTKEIKGSTVMSIDNILRNPEN